ncbi:chemotaxis protein CheA [Gemmatimonas groenlandica]|uniref:histidine kinase n=1 Tax=Gemmatimonas groenlandica TaxID=2732249 RepID=A0A6M4IWA3_9BACT|nr:chemotaxis protein CheA [Gemmatimonas groenlandica]QJR36461.1 histidine kinase [Gemmatimonas groenlandica]
MSDTGDSNEIVNEFLVESYEGLDQLDLDLVELEQCGGNAELIGRVFRCVHTIKGTCGFLGFGGLESVAHVGENLLSKVRDGSIGVSPDLTSALLRLNDAIRSMLTHIEAHGKEGEFDHADLIAALVRLTDAKAAQVASDAAISEQELADALELPPAIPLLGEILVEQGHVSTADIAAAVHEQNQTGAPRVGEILVARGATTHAAVKEALETQQDARAGHVSDGSIRVDVALLDRLMNLVGELVLARNQILQCTATNADSTLNSTTQRLNLITSELQEGVMKTRMQPIGNIWSKLPRVVRDLAVTCSKQVTIQMEGAETELDKTIIEAIKDPLTHIVRNSIDHGIESPRDRVLNDKSPEGRLLLRAFHEGGQVNIEITDDGKGIDPVRLRAAAVDKGVLTAEAAARLSDREALHLIFAPGFSTAAKVTNVSGRGVGMDVVKTNIEKIGGTVDVTSTVGVGTTLRIKIPLTLAIIPGLIITSGAERFAIPQVSLLELVRMEHEEAKTRIEMIYDSPVYRLRGKLLPLVHLNRTLGLARTPWPNEPGAPDVATSIVVLQTDGVPFGLVVDHINDTEEIVVKPLGKQLKGISSFAGATIMGDGRVALILDVHGLAQRAGVLATDRDRHAAEQRTEQRAAGEPMQTLLVFSSGGDHRMALPLSEIARLEEFEPTLVERTGRYDVVQYRDQIMPLVRLGNVLEGVSSNAAADDMMQVIVVSHNEQYVGLVVDRIVDIVETTVSVQQRRRPGTVLGSAVIQNKVTDILDIRRLVQDVDEEFLAIAPTGGFALHG